MWIGGHMCGRNQDRCEIRNHAHDCSFSGESRVLVSVPVNVMLFPYPFRTSSIITRQRQRFYKVIVYSFSQLLLSCRFPQPHSYNYTQIIHVRESVRMMVVGNIFNASTVSTTISHASFHINDSLYASALVISVISLALGAWGAREYARCEKVFWC
jgi:hypothetical protein